MVLLLLRVVLQLAWLLRSGSGSGSLWNGYADVLHAGVEQSVPAGLAAA